MKIRKHWKIESRPSRASHKNTPTKFPNNWWVHWAIKFVIKSRKKKIDRSKAIFESDSFSHPLMCG